MQHKTHLVEQVYVRVARTLSDLQDEQWCGCLVASLHKRYFHWVGVAVEVPALLVANALSCVDLYKSTVLFMNTMSQFAV